MHNKTFRLFISSTFSDFTGEREAMQTKVFPAVEALCASFGYQFQAVDLRWGVNEEAQLDQKTIEICLNEVKTCKHYPHPNFLIMIGNRYGWVPLPYAIEKKEFESILNYYSGEKKKAELLTSWYQLDLNHLCSNNSTAYVLKSRSGKYKDYPVWSSVEESLKALLQQAVKEIDNISEIEKYFISATEQEVIHGILSYHYNISAGDKTSKTGNDDRLNDIRYIFGFLREIIKGDNAAIQSQWYDSNEEMVSRFRQNLRKTLLPENKLEITTPLILPDKPDERYIPAFTEKFFSFLNNSVREQIENISEISDEQKIISEHQAFKEEKLRVFVGRKKILKDINEYIKSASDAPFIVFGDSGMGKSALMAKAIDEAEQNTDSRIIYRFVGVSENSGNIRSLLLSIICELESAETDSLETIYNDDIFNENIAKVLSEITGKTVIFIDALDQLPEKSYLKWLPAILPPDLKIVISVLKDENYEKDSGYHDQFRAKYSNEKYNGNFAELTPMNKSDGEEMLTGMLRQLNRTLTGAQKEYVIDQFKQSGFSPLFMTVAFEEIRNWKSFSTDFKYSLNNSITGGIKEFIRDLSQVYHHQNLFVTRVLGYIECSRNGLSEKEILDLLSSDDDIMTLFESQYHRNLSGRIPVAPWARLYTQLSPFLAEKMADDVSLISMFHRQFRTVIRTDIISGTEERRAFHSRLAQYFRKQPLITSENIYNLRKLSEQAYQLYHSDSAEDLVEFIEDDFIRVKLEAGRFYDCLNDIEQAFILADSSGQASSELKRRLFAALLTFFNNYSEEQKKLFGYDSFHAYFIYRNNSEFYQQFLEKATKKEFMSSFFPDKTMATDYYLLFLTSYVGFLRRKSRLKEAGDYIKEIIGEYRDRVDEGGDNNVVFRQLSTAFYELGYINYLTGNFIEADKAFSKSVYYANQCNNTIGEWITKCVMKRLACIGGLATVDDFDHTLDEAYTVFKELEATNHAAKRWVMNVLHHKFEVGFLKNDNKMMRYYFNFIRVNEWNLEHNVPMDLFEAQIAFSERDFSKAIRFYHSYLNRWDENIITKTEAFADIYRQIGAAYCESRNKDMAKEFFNKAMALDDEPANHIPKQKVMDYLDHLHE